MSAPAEQISSRRSNVDQLVAVRKRSRIDKRFIKVLYGIWKNLSSKVHDLYEIFEILEHTKVVSIETNVIVLFTFVKKILTYVNHAAVEMVKSFCENFCHPLIGFRHEVIFDGKCSLVAAI